MIWVGDEIVVKESAMTFLDHLPVGRVEDGVVYGVEVEVDALLGNLGAVTLVGTVEGPDIGGDG